MCVCCAVPLPAMHERPSFAAHSRHALPLAYQDLMTNAASPIIDYYPEDIKQDPNGKRFSWQWVVLLPFIDEKRLTDALNALKVRLRLCSLDQLAACIQPCRYCLQFSLTPDEIRRDKRGNDTLFLCVQSAYLSGALRDFCLSAVPLAVSSGVPQMRSLVPPPEGSGELWLSVFGRVLIEGDEPQVGSVVSATGFSCRPVRNCQVRALAFAVLVTVQWEVNDGFLCLC
jgi:hypothetical protein